MKLQTRIGGILALHPQTRENDMTLYAQYLITEGYDPSQLTVNGLALLINSKSVSGIGSVSAAKRTWQRKDKALKTA